MEDAKGGIMGTDVNNLSHPDYDELLHVVMPMAEQLLAQNGEFSPIVLLVTADGDINHLETEGEFGSSVDESLSALSSLIRSVVEPGDIRAIAICFHAEITPPGESRRTNAIIVHLEHAVAPSGASVFPYRSTGSGELAYSGGFVEAREPVYFLKQPALDDRLSGPGSGQ